MVKTLYKALKENARFTGALRWYLVWGLTIRSILLLGLTYLLLIEGNFLLEWLLSWGLPSSSVEDLAEITILSYIVIAGILLVGMVLRAAVLYRMGHLSISRENSGENEQGKKPDSRNR